MVEIKVLAVFQITGKSFVLFLSFFVLDPSTAVTKTSPESSVYSMTGLSFMKSSGDSGIQMLFLTKLIYCS